MWTDSADPRLQHRVRKHSFTAALLLTFHSLSYYYLPASRFSLLSFSVGRVRETTFGHIPGPPLTCGNGAAGALLPQPGFQRYCPAPHLSENRNQSHTLLSWEDGLSSSPASQEGRSAEGALVHAQSPPSPHLHQVRFLKSTEPRARHSLFCKAAPSQPKSLTWCPQCCGCRTEPGGQPGRPSLSVCLRFMVKQLPHTLTVTCVSHLFFADT